MILIISSSKDEHAKTVFQLLKSKQAEVEIIDLSCFPQRMNLSMYLNNDCPSFLLNLEKNRKLDLGRVKSIWWRRPQHFELHPEITKPAHLNFAFNESNEAISGLWQNLDVHWVNKPAKDEIANRKAYQLKLAAMVGFEIPRTLISNSPGDVEQFLQTQGIQKTIYKAFSATMQDWRETRIVKQNELSLLQNVKYAPVIFQEYVEAAADVRITVIGDHIFPAAIYSQQTAYKYDFRMDMNNAKVEAVKLPKEVEKNIRQFMRQLGLVYGAIDMRLTPEGRYVFLEINPAGQWLFIEQRTKQKIAEAMALELLNGGEIKR